MVILTVFSTAIGTLKSCMIRGRCMEQYHSPLPMGNNFEHSMTVSMRRKLQERISWIWRVNSTVGVFWYNTAETWVDVNAYGPSTTNQNLYFMSETGSFDVFLFLGPSFYEVTEQYVVITGNAPLPPVRNSNIFLDCLHIDNLLLYILWFITFSLHDRRR